MLGDMLAQRLEGQAVINFVRIAHLGLYGFMLDGPVGHIWYKCGPRPVLGHTLAVELL
jgi:hypothetical protein